MKNNLKFYLMSTLCCVALINTHGYSMHKNAMPYKDNTSSMKYTDTQPTGILLNNNLRCYSNAIMQCLHNLPAFRAALKFLTLEQRNKMRQDSNLNHNIISEFMNVMDELDKVNQKPFATTKFSQLMAQANQLFKAGQGGDAKDFFMNLCDIFTDYNSNDDKEVDLTSIDIKTVKDFTNIQKTDEEQSIDTNIVTDSNKMLEQCINENENSPLFEPFMGYYETEYYCKECKSTVFSTQNESFILMQKNNIKNYFKNNNSIQNEFTLDECFDYWMMHEFGNNSEFYCAICASNDQQQTESDKLTDRKTNKMKKATKSNDIKLSERTVNIIKRLPEILTIILDSGKEKKDGNIGVSVQQEIDLACYVDWENKSQNTKFRLNSLVIHKGDSSPTGGHYVAYIRNGSQWWCCDCVDEQVKPVDDRDIQKILSKDSATSTKYLLFYEKLPDNVEKQSNKLKQISTKHNLNNIKLNDNVNYRNKNNIQNYNTLNNNNIKRRNIQLNQINTGFNNRNITNNINNINKTSNDIYYINEGFNTRKVNDNVNNINNNIMNTNISQINSKVSNFNINNNINRINNNISYINRGFNNINMNNNLNKINPINTGVNNRNITNNVNSSYNNRRNDNINQIPTVPNSNNNRMNVLNRSNTNNNINNYNSNNNYDSSNRNYYTLEYASVNNTNNELNLQKVNINDNITNDNNNKYGNSAPSSVNDIKTESDLKQVTINMDINELSKAVWKIRANKRIVHAEISKFKNSEFRGLNLDERISKLFPVMTSINQHNLQGINNIKDMTTKINDLLRETINFCVNYNRHENKYCITKFCDAWTTCIKVLQQKRGQYFVNLLKSVKELVQKLLVKTFEFNKYYIK